MKETKHDRREARATHLLDRVPSGSSGQSSGHHDGRTGDGEARWTDES
jgi:hypothetical protein